MAWKVVSFNVNGVRARLTVVLDWLNLHKPDVFCMQEIKCQDHEFPAEPFVEAGYIVNVHGQKAFSGVATLTKSSPVEAIRGTGVEELDREARLLTVLVDGAWVVNTYVPQGRDPQDPAFQYKLNFLSALKRWFEEHFDPGRPLIWTGDLNVAPEAIDVFDAKRLEGHVGFHPDERNALADVKSWGLIDLFRKHHPDRKQFTFWDYRLPMSFQRNLGWRLDHILVTEPLARASVECLVDSEPRGLEKPSDHTPIWAEFDLKKLKV